MFKITVSGHGIHHYHTLVITVCHLNQIVVWTTMDILSPPPVVRLGKIPKKICIALHLKQDKHKYVGITENMQLLNLPKSSLGCVLKALSH